MATENSVLPDELLARTHNAILLLKDCVEVNPQKRGGAPVLKGTRFSVAQLLAEIAEGRGVAEIAADFDLDLELIKKLLEGLALSFDGPV